MGDSAYGSAEMLGWLVYDHGIEPRVTVFDKSSRKDGTFSRADFAYDQGARRLPLSWRHGTAARPERSSTTGRRCSTLRFNVNARDAPSSLRCCPNTPARKVPRSIHEGARDMARQIARSWEGSTSRRLRKKVEMLFAHLKRILKLDRLRLRGPTGAHDEFLLAATAQNLRKLAKFVPTPKLKAA